MTHAFTIYYVEVMEEGVPKIVPHTKGKKYYKFADGKQATTFMKKLKTNYPDKQFRRVMERTTTEQEQWI